MGPDEESENQQQAQNAGAPAPEPMYCRDCRSPLSGQGRGRCPRCGRPFNSHNPRTYVTSPTAPHFVWHGVISWGFFLVAQVYAALVIVFFGSTGITWTPYLLLLAVGVGIGVRGAFIKPWLNQVIACIALMAYALSLASLIAFVLHVG